MKSFHWTWTEREVFKWNVSTGVPPPSYIYAYKQQQLTSSLSWFVNLSWTFTTSNPQPSFLVFKGDAEDNDDDDEDNDENDDDNAEDNDEKGDDDGIDIDGDKRHLVRRSPFLVRLCLLDLLRFQLPTLDQWWCWCWRWWWSSQMIQKIQNSLRSSAGSSDEKMDWGGSYLIIVIFWGMRRILPLIIALLLADLRGNHLDPEKDFLCKKPRERFVKCKKPWERFLCKRQKVFPKSRYLREYWLACNHTG